jgi:hypothetical protein
LREDINGLPEHVVPQLVNEAAPKNQIHLLDPKQALKMLLRLDEMQEPDRAAEFHQQVNIAGIPCFVTRGRTKESQRSHVESGLEVPLLLPEAPHDFFAFHCPTSPTVLG